MKTLSQLTDADARQLNRLIEFVEPMCYCPCCQQTEVCFDECDMEKECPLEWHRMMVARNALFGETKPQNK